MRLMQASTEFTDPREGTGVCVWAFTWIGVSHGSSTQVRDPASLALNMPRTNRAGYFELQK